MNKRKSCECQQDVLPNVRRKLIFMDKNDLNLKYEFCHDCGQLCAVDNYTLCPHTETSGLEHLSSTAYLFAECMETPNCKEELKEPPVLQRKKSHYPFGTGSPFGLHLNLSPPDDDENELEKHHYRVRLLNERDRLNHLIYNYETHINYMDCREYRLDLKKETISEEDAIQLLTQESIYATPNGNGVHFSTSVCRDETL